MRALPVVIAAAMIALAAVISARPAEPAEPGAAADGGARPAGLPPVPQAIGPLRRDETGSIVPVAPPDGGSAGRGEGPPRGRASRVTAGPFDPRPLIILGDTSFVARLQDPADREREAQAIQRDVDRVLREEARRKKQGVPVDGNGLTPREAALLQELERRHNAILARGRAQFWIGRPYAGMARYWYVTGPLQRRFAAAALSRFDVSPVGKNVEATIAKLESLIRAALSPVSPTERDREMAEELKKLVARLRGKN